MPWVRLDDGYPEHPKVDRVGPMAAWLNVCAWAYCARNLTDGFVPAERVARLAQVAKPQQLAERLVEANLWEPVEGGYQVHDYLAYNPSRDQILKERAATADRVADWRAKRGGKAPPPGNGVTGHVTNGVTTGVGNGVSTPAPIPAPVRPQESKDSSPPPGGPPRLRVVGEPVPKPTSSPTPVGRLIDKIRAIDPNLEIYGDQSFTGRKLKENPGTDLDLVAEAYVAFRHGEWPGSKLLRESGALAWVIGDLGGYVAWRSSRRGAVPRKSDDEFSQGRTVGA